MMRFELPSLGADMEDGTLLESPWNKLTAEQQRVWLYGTGKEHITYPPSVASTASG